ncbi:hypothetical protein CHH80_20035 [Bacillus sp. 7504-2]|nr:hypothetical protein CHH80_20035 [Bacillus sp. 7504-2]
MRRNNRFQSYVLHEKDKPKAMGLSFFVRFFTVTVDNQSRGRSMSAFVSFTSSRNRMPAPKEHVFLKHAPLVFIQL